MSREQIHNCMLLSSPALRYLTYLLLLKKKKKVVFYMLISFIYMPVLYYKEQKPISKDLMKSDDRKLI